MASTPVDLLALVMNPNANAKAAPAGDAPPDSRLAQALSLAIDRAAIVNVLLQKQGEPAGSLLPQWLSGYAFLFPTTPNIAQAKQLVQDRQHTGQVSNMRQMALVYDGADSIAATVAERIAVNARDAGITLTVSAEKQGAASSKAELRLVRWRIDVPDAQQALQDFLARGGIMQLSAASMAIDSPEQRYAAERAAVDGGGIVPLVFLPEIFALGPAVRDWMPPRWGGWRLEDVWLDTTMRATVAGAGGGTGNN
jgi:ABC-type transport system substrate-binding protein